MTLLDTNTVIHYLRGQPSVVARLQNADPRQIAGGGKSSHNFWEAWNKSHLIAKRRASESIWKLAAR
jgi:hypothetical protein